MTMMELLSKQFSKVMGVVAVLIIIMGTIAGGLWGIYIMETGDEVVGIFSLIFGVFLGAAVAYLLDVMVFGYMAQIMSINSKLDRIEVVLRGGDPDARQPEEKEKDETPSDSCIYYCRKCDALWKGSSHMLSSEMECPRCKGQTVKTGLSLNEWNALSEDEKTERKKQWAERS